MYNIFINVWHRKRVHCFLGGISYPFNITTPETMCWWKSFERLLCDSHIWCESAGCGGSSWCNVGASDPSFPCSTYSTPLSLTQFLGHHLLEKQRVAVHMFRLEEQAFSVCLGPLWLYTFHKYVNPQTYVPEPDYIYIWDPFRLDFSVISALINKRHEENREAGGWEPQVSLWSSYRVKQRSEWRLLVRLVIGLSDDAFHGIFIKRDLHTCNWVSIGAPSWPMMGRSNPGVLHQMKLEKTVNGWAATAEDTGGHSYKVQLITSSGPTVEQMAYMLWLCLQETLEQQIYIQQTDPWLPGSRVGKEIKDEMGFLEGKRIRNSGNGLALEI